MPLKLETEIEILASANTVWSVLTNWEDFPNWNPFIQQISGELKEGVRIDVEIHSPGARKMKFNPVIKEVVPGKKLRWLGTLMMKGIFDGEHIFEIDEVKPGVCLFKHRENFSGYLIYLYRRMLNENTREGFEQMNRALKEKCESNENI